MGSVSKLLIWRLDGAFFFDVFIVYVVNVGTGSLGER